MKVACSRAFQVEALRDGRLSGAELTRFQSHLDACAACAREAQALEAIAQAVRSSSTVGHDELHVRRERIRLLSAFDAALVPAPPSRFSTLRRGAVLALVMCAAVALAFMFWPASLPPAPAKLAEPVSIHADASANWSRQVQPQLEKITLDTGTLAIRVDRALSRRRLLVVLPDGELEDIGTTFSVSADGRRTTSVTVRDGSVELRLHGKQPILLSAGDSWTPAPAPSATPVPETKPAAPTIRSAKPPTSAAPVSTAHQATPDAAGDFRAAMSALNGGDNALAAALFAAFLGEHPRDARCEDAAYLRVIALQRAGSPSMKLAGDEYLRRFPQGFRHAEVEALTR